MVKLTKNFKQKAKIAKEKGYSGYYITLGGGFGTDYVLNSPFNKAISGYGNRGKAFTKGSKKYKDFKKKYIQYSKLMRL